MDASLDLTEDIAVVGMGLVVPGADSPEAFWARLMEGADPFRLPPTSRWRRERFESSDPQAEDKTYCSLLGLVDDGSPTEDGRDVVIGWLRRSIAAALTGVRLAPRDRLRYTLGYSPDVCQALETALVVEDARRGLAEALGADPPGEALTALDAALREGWPRAVRPPAELLPHRVLADSALGLLPEGTPAVTVDTACASGLYAIALGVAQLLQGSCDVAICAGASSLGPINSVLFGRLGGLPRAAGCRPLDQGSDGVVFSDGAAVVVLKRLARARQDGDRIAVVIKAFGGSSDGRGKAIYAPSAPGQRRAIERCQAHPSFDPDRLALVIAHATGTPAGDAAELESLCSTATGPRLVVSNKAVVGHTGWAAGVVSVIHAALVLRHGLVPPQPRFTAARLDAQGAAQLHIPTRPTPLPWARGGAPLIAVSAFGFGGINGQLLLGSDSPERAAAPPPVRPHGARIAVVAWGCRVPGLTTEANRHAWLTGTGPDPGPSFGELYPDPGERVRLSGRTRRATDRAQLMTLECLPPLIEALFGLWEASRERAGVYLGHCGKTRHGVLSGRRVHLDDLRQQLMQTWVAGRPERQGALDAYAERVRAAVPAAIEDSFPGVMPNVIPARVANAHDLHGPTMTLDAGFASTFAALEAACQGLRAGEVDLAIAGAVNGNALPDAAQALRALTGRSDLIPAEGVFLFAMVREHTAASVGLRPLAFIDEMEAGPAGVRATAPGLHYLGAQGAVALARALARLAASPAPARPLPLSDTDERGHIVGRYTLSPGPPESPTRRSASPVATPAPPPDEVERHVLTLRALLDEQTAPSRPLFPVGDGVTLLLTDQPELAQAVVRLAGAAEVVILSTTPGPGVHWVATVDERALDLLPGAVVERLRHVRVLTDLRRATAGGPVTATPPAALALHDLLFLATQHGARSGQLRSVATLLLDAVEAAAPHPLAALYAGMLGTFAQELPGIAVYGVATDEPSLSQALAEADAEASLARPVPMVVRVGGRRHAELPTAAPISGSRVGSAPGTEPTVVVVGGARGVAAALSRALAARGRPRIYVLGRQPLAAIESASPPGAPTEGRRDFITRRLIEAPGRPVKDLIAEHERLDFAREAQETLRSLRARLGPDRVRYLACDVTRADEVQVAVDTIMRESAGIDLLIFAAGIDESQSLTKKPLGSFRAVRDLKLLGHQNLRRALAGRPPRHWWNIGSLTGVFGNEGQADYAAANAWLAAAARFAPTPEVTLAFTLWDEVGIITHPQKRELAGTLRARFTAMSTEEGVRHFLRELDAGGPAPVVTWLGARERRWASAAAQAPRAWLQHNAPAIAQAPVEGGPMLDEVLERGPTRVVFGRTLDLERDPILRDHIVQDIPTLPGTFALELGAEAAAALVPELVLIGFDDVSFDQLVRVPPGRPLALRVVAERLTDPRPGEARVHATMVSDVFAPGGVLLKRDRVHATMTVCFAGAPVPEGPVLAAPASGARPAVDPYLLPGAPIRLSGVFVTTSEGRLFPGERPVRDRRTALYRSPVDPADATLRRFLVPALLLDGLLRVPALGDEPSLPVYAPRRVRAVRLWGSTNDARLAAEAAVLTVSAEGTLGTENGTTPRNILEARRADGRLVARIEDLEGVVIGEVQAPRCEPARLERLSAAYKDYLDATTATTAIDSFPALIAAKNAYPRALRSLGYDFYFRPVSEPRGHRVEIEGRHLLPLGSYGYLGLLGHPAIDAAAHAAIDRYGTGTHGVRALAGTLTLHRALEERIARFKGTDDAIVYTSGFTANVATISALVGAGDWIICDTLDHASIVDGARLSGARHVQFQHGRLSSLELRLKHCTGGRKLVVVDAVFSMDGDVVDLPAVAALCRRYDAWLMVDEAHSTGVLGARGHGVLEHFGMAPDSVQILMGTLSKAIPSVGGYVAAQADIIEFLRLNARGFVFSAALPPPQAAAALAALDVIDAEPERIARLWANTRRFREGLQRLGFDTLTSTTPIIPILGGTAERTLEMARLCFEAGVFVPPVVYPVVPITTPRLRSNMSAAYSDADVDFVLATLAHIGRGVGVIPQDRH